MQGKWCRVKASGSHMNESSPELVCCCFPFPSSTGKKRKNRYVRPVFNCSAPRSPCLARGTLHTRWGHLLSLLSFCLLPAMGKQDKRGNESNTEAFAAKGEIAEFQLPALHRGRLERPGAGQQRLAVREQGLGTVTRVPHGAGGADGRLPWGWGCC